jgi:branched-chain amino acid transport system permease protein
MSQEVVNRQRMARRALVLGGIGLAAALPAVAPSSYVMHLLVMSALWAILALSMELVLGVTGLLSAAHGALFGIGGYTAALLVVRAGWNSWPALLLAAIAGALGGLLIGLPTLRARGPYFVISSLCFGLVVQIVIDKWDAVTFGPVGVSSIPAPSPIAIPGVGRISFDSVPAQYWAILATLIVVVIGVGRIVDSRVGRAFQAIRVNEGLAEALGVPTARLSLLAFVLSGAIAGVAGGFYGFYITFLSPADASFWISLNAILFVVVGGAGTIGGPIVGAFVMTVLPETLRLFEEWRLFIFGLLLIVVMIGFPQGIAGGARALWGRATRRRAEESSGA